MRIGLGAYVSSSLARSLNERPVSGRSISNARRQNAFRQREGVLYFDAGTPDRALDLRMAEQDLNCAEILVCL